MEKYLPRTSYHYCLVLPRDKVEHCPKFGVKLDDTSSPLRPSIQIGTRRANLPVGKAGRRGFSTTFLVQSKSLASAKCSSSLVYLNRINQKNILNEDVFWRYLVCLRLWKCCPLIVQTKAGRSQLAV